MSAPESAPERSEAQRKVLSTLLARFTADRDVLITAVQECERQVAALAARLDALPASGGRNNEHPQTVAPAQLAELRQKIALVQREQRQAATHARATAEHAMLRADEALRSVEELGTVRQPPNGQTEQLLERLAKEHDALRASVRDSAERVAAVASQSDTDRDRSAKQLAELRQLIEQVHLNQQQAESRAREAERNTMSCVRDALRRVEELGGTLRTSERTSAELAALHGAADRLTADVEQVKAETARCKQVLATCAQTGVVSELVERVGRMQGDMRLLQQAVGEAREGPPRRPAAPAQRGPQGRSPWLRPALLVAALTLATVAAVAAVRWREATVYPHTRATRAVAIDVARRVGPPEALQPVEVTPKVATTEARSVPSPAPAQLAAAPEPPLPPPPARLVALDPRGATACVLAPAQHRLCVYRGTAAGIVPDACYAVVVPQGQHWPQWLVTAELTSRQMSLVDTTGRLRFRVLPAGEAAASPTALQLSAADFAALAATVTRWRTGWVVRSASPTAASAPPAAAVRAAVEHWRQAWEHKELADYVSSYAKSFRSSQDSDQAHWKARKRALFARSGSISIRLAGVSAFSLDEGRTVLTTFEQTYRSDIFASRAFKVLRWQYEDGRWAIAAETVLREES